MSRIDPEGGALPGQPRPERGWGWKLVGVAIVTYMGLCGLGSVVNDRIPYTCAVCRTERVDRRVLGMRSSDQEETDCSRWYRHNVEAKHAHFWLEGSHCRRYGIPGLYGGYACRGGSLIDGLSTRVQVEIFQHFDDRQKAKRLFIRSGRQDPLGRRDPERGRLWEALMGWVEAGYPGTWDHWWERRRAAAEG